MYPLFVSFQIIPIVFNSTPSQLILMKDLTHLVLLREKTTIQKCQYQMIAKMNYKFQSGLKMLS